VISLKLAAWLPAARLAATAISATGSRDGKGPVDAHAHAQIQPLWRPERDDRALQGKVAGADMSKLIVTRRIDIEALVKASKVGLRGDAGFGTRTRADMPGQSDARRSGVCQGPSKARRTLAHRL
jgi:hypothetical protein